MGKILGILLLTAIALNSKADVNGKPVVVPTDCNSVVFSSADKICSLFAFAGSDVCTKTANNCASVSQELFTGTNLEAANYAQPKGWTGFGSTGALYSSAQLCLLRDLKDAPIESVATATTKIGDASIKQRLQFLSFDKGTKTWQGYHVAAACAPAIGCIDIISQKITAKPVQNNVKGTGKKAGEYEIYTAYGIDVTADSIAQGFQVQIPALNVYTPYGVVSAIPKFELSRNMGLVLAPYNQNNVKSTAVGVWGNAKMTEIYGRTAGVEQSTIYPAYLITGASKTDNRYIGYNSQVAFGSRNVDPNAAIWAPTAGQEFPLRPDADLNTSRSNAEKTPNAQLSAGVKIQYSPVALLPSAIVNNRFITLGFNVYVEPKVGANMSAQVNFNHSEISVAKDIITPQGPADVRVNKVEQHKSFSVTAGSNVAALFGLYAGVDLVIHLHVPLFITDIDVDLINIHPKTTVLESITKGTGVGNRSAYAKTRVQEAMTTKKSYQEYKTLMNTQPLGTDHVAACFAQPSASAPPPADPKYQPGNMQDLIAGVEYPCNICVGMNDYNYQDNDGKTQTINGFLVGLFQSPYGAGTASGRWACDNVAKSGCYDMCKYDPATNKLTVVRTAVQMRALGQAQDMPLRCR
ncbi:hypothetical protein CIK05_01140 [Bdellovibrio sp. qaytius]|nr:hypothetical protein CIK05_01140 [Bdellovibrio sp. qaytius]